MEFRLRPLGFMEFFFAKQQSSENEMNRKSKKYSKKTVGILSESLCVIVSVWECVCVCVCMYVGGYSCVFLYVCVGGI